MKNKKKLFAAIMAITMTCITLSGCTGDEPPANVNEMGDVSGVELEQGEDENAAGLPIYDTGNLPVSTTLVSFQQVNGYYRQQLDTRNSIAYNDIKNAALEAKNSINLSKSVTPEELFKLMLILYVDDADVFYISSQYGYEAPQNGYINTVYLYYDLPVVGAKKTDATIATEQNLINSYLQGIYAASQQDKSKAVDLFSRTDNDFVVARTAIERTMRLTNNPRKASAYFAAMCRYVGINATVKIGKSTSSDLSSYWGLTEDGFNFLSDVSRYTTTNENGQSTVNYPTSDFMYWNAIEINGNWYNIDLSSNFYYSRKKDTDIEKINWFSFVPDYLISMSRISKYTEDLLGTIPACDDQQYGNMYRSGKYLLTHSETQVPIKLAEVLDSIKAKKQTITYQFKDENTFRNFIDKFPAAVDTYNTTYEGVLLSYDLNIYQEALIVEIANVKYKGDK